MTKDRIGQFIKKKQVVESIEGGAWVKIST
jgi:hypothetical protein